MGSLLTISELAARTGFSASALRYYEQVGLLAAAERSAGGYRLYDEAAITRLRFIDRAKQLGLRLEEIRELVAVWDAGLCGHVQEDLRGRIRAKQVQVQARIAGLSAFAVQLDQAAGALSTRTPGSPCGPGCGCVDGGPAGEPVADRRPAAPQLVALGPTRRLPVPAGSRAGVGAGAGSGWTA